MIYELLYTSVPKGLKPGAKGYCTVLTTEGIPSALLERLEGYCGYRHLFDPGSPDNPEAFGHRVLNLAGNTWHILSRVADAGFDYSGRSNLIGHFMAISQDELKAISAGPTSLMMSPGLFRKELVGEPRRVSEAETSKRLVGVMDRPQKAVTWNMVTGDAGWAGKLVQTTEESSESVSLIYPLRTNTLKLLDEAASILPKNKQWDITFNTFFTKSGEECRWRCYCANVPEAVPFKGSEFDLVDVKRKGLDPGDGVYVGAAREGKKIAGGVAKTGPAIARNPLSGPRRSLIKEAREIQKSEEKKQEEWVEELGIESPKGKFRDSIRPASSKTVPPPVLRDNRFDLELDESVYEMEKISRKVSQGNPYKSALLILIPISVLSVLFLTSALLISILRKSPTKQRELIVVANNENLVEKSKDTEIIKPSVPKSTDQKNAKSKQSGLNGTNASAAAAAPNPPTASNPVAAAPNPPTASNPVAAAPNPPTASNPAAAAPDAKAVKLLVRTPDIKSNECTVLFDKTLVIPLDKYLTDRIKDENEMARIQNDGILIELPFAFPLKGELFIYDNFSPERKNVINKVEILDGLKSMKVTLPKVIEESGVYNVCLAVATSKYEKSILQVQFFTPLEIQINKPEIVKADPRTQRAKSDSNIGNTRFTFWLLDNKINNQKYHRIRLIQEGRFADKDVNTSTSFISEDNEIYKLINNDTAEMKGMITKLNSSDRNFDTLPLVFVGMPGKFPDNINRLFTIDNYRLFVPLSFDELKIANPQNRKYVFIKPEVFSCSREVAYSEINSKISGWGNVGSHDLYSELLAYFKIPETDRVRQCGVYVDSQTNAYNRIKSYIMDGDSGELYLLGPPGFLVKLDLNKDKSHLDRKNTKINLESHRLSIVVGQYVREKK